MKREKETEDRREISIQLDLQEKEENRSIL